MSIYDSILEPDRLTIRNMAEIEPKAVDFLLYPYIPRGKITLLQGDPGQGKTMLALKIAADISCGRGFLGEERGPPAPVLYQTAEDGLADTIVPRLMMMAPQLENIHCIDESQKGLTLRDERLEQALRQIRPSLVIIDPLQAYLGSDVDMHRANQVRPLLSRIGILAEQYDCAILFIVHMSKMSQSKAMYRTLGSIDIPAAARSQLVVGCNPDDPGQKVFAHIKSSLAPEGKSVAFYLDDECGIVYEGHCDLTAEQILGPPRTEKKKHTTAERVVKQCLGSKGYAKLSDIYAMAEQAGVKRRTLSRSKETLGLQRKTCGFEKKETWWYLPGVNIDVVVHSDLAATEETTP